MRETEKSIAEQTIKSLENDQLFLNQAGEPHIAFTERKKFYVLPIGGPEFRRLMMSRAYGLTRTVVPPSAITLVISNLEAQAVISGQKIQLAVRFKRRGNSLLFDLCDSRGRYVRIRDGKWEVRLPGKPIFARYTHQLPIPIPKAGGDVQEIFDYVNVVGLDQQLSLLAWLGAAFVADVPRPILHLSGPQGSGKSTIGKMLRSLVDPSKVLMVNLPTNPTDLALILQQNALPFFDNLTWINPRVSEMLCSSVSGGGSVKRRLYTDDGAVIFNFMRPIITTAINTPTAAPDLLDRFVSIRSDIPKVRRTEAQLWEKFNAARSHILGGLLDVLARATNIIHKIQYRESARMADFAHWGTAITVALGYKADQFNDALAENTRWQTEEVLQSNPVAESIQQLLAAHKRWEGTPTRLLHELNDLIPDNVGVPGWPRSANHLTRRLKSLQTALQGIGIKYHSGKSKGGKLIVLRKGK
jgi:energy-coupling factor transporter ATP-binding protein EcfA2